MSNNLVLISPYSQQLRNGAVNPKNYPFWNQLCSMIQQKFDVHLVQVGLSRETQILPDFRRDLDLKSLADLIQECTTWIGCDSFFQHYCWDLGKRGIVLWGPSDPLIYGHIENVNLLKSRELLLPNQFLIWEQAPLRTECFVEPEVVCNALKIFLLEKNSFHVTTKHETKTRMVTLQGPPF
jgi:Glycosyltransferase family 9 (heptosyltransferase)